MNPKADIFFDAISHLREDIVEEAQDYRFRKKPAVWKKAGSLAACLCLIASLSLLMLPRGCGSAGGSAGMNTSGAPPQTSDSSAPADAPTYSGNPAESAPMPEPEEPAAPPEDGDGQIGGLQLLAVILEIREDSLLVESGGEQYAVFTAGLELPELTEGDTVRITCSGSLLTASPAGIPDPVSIEKIENNG